MNDKTGEKDRENRYSDDESSSDDSFNLDVELKCEICNKTFSSVKSLLQHEKSGKHHKQLSKKKLEKKLGKCLEDELSSELIDLMLIPESFANCDTCKKKFNGPESFHQHLKSKVHHKNVAKAKLLDKVTDNGKIDVGKLKEVCKQKNSSQEELPEVGASGYSPVLEETDSDDYDKPIAESHQFECIDCDKVFTGINPWYQHLISKTHEKTLKQKKLFVQLTSSMPSSSNAESTPVASSAQDTDVIEVNGDVLTCQLCHKAFSGPESATDHIKSKGHAKKKELKMWRIKHMVKSATRATGETLKTKAQDIKNDNQTSNSTSSIEFEENKPSSDINDDVITENNPSNTPPKGDFDLVGESRGGLTNTDSSLSEAVSVTGSVSNAEKENTLLCYKSYKNYKKIMNEIEAENN